MTAIMKTNCRSYFKQYVLGGNIASPFKFQILTTREIISLSEHVIFIT